MEKIKQKEMAAVVGVSEGQLSRFLAGKSRGRQVAERIAQAGGGDWTEYFIMTERVLRSRLADIVSKQRQSLKRGTEAETCQGNE